jgi:Mor family transcriptional regulator
MTTTIIASKKKRIIDSYKSGKSIKFLSFVHDLSETEILRIIHNDNSYLIHVVIEAEKNPVKIIPVRIWQEVKIDIPNRTRKYNYNKSIRDFDIIRDYKETHNISFLSRKYKLTRGNIYHILYRYQVKEEKKK